MEPAGRLVGASEIVTRVEGVGVVRSQNIGVVGEGLFEQGDGLTDPAGCLVGASEIVARGERVRGWWGPRMRAESSRVCWSRGMAWSSLPAAWQAPARLLREAKVSRWSGPRIRLRSSRFCWSRGMARSSLPAAW